MDVAALCRDLVRIRSENPPGDTRDIAAYIGSVLDGLGIENAAVSKDGRRCNLISRCDGASLLLCGHIDVVPALPDGWRHPPFAGVEEDGYIWGRGSSDMKGGCAALLAALGRIVDEGAEPRAGIAFVCDEETSTGYGIEYLLAKHMLSPCDTLIAEPTPALSPCIGQKGLARLSLAFHGEPGHSSLYPAVGKSAIMEAHRLISFLREIHRREYRSCPEMDGIVERSSAVLEGIFGIPGLDHVLRQVMFNPGVIRGGEKANIVAEYCDLDLDLRIPWGCSANDIVAEIAAQVPDAEMTVTVASDPSCTSPSAPIVRRLCDAIERAYGGEPVPIFQWAASDARHLRRAGFPSVEYGPGEVRTIHGIDERVSIRSLHLAEEIYRDVILSYS